MVFATKTESYRTKPEGVRAKASASDSKCRLLTSLLAYCVYESQSAHQATITHRQLGPN